MFLNSNVLSHTFFKVAQMCNILYIYWDMSLVGIGTKTWSHAVQDKSRLRCRDTNSLLLHWRVAQNVLKCTALLHICYWEQEHHSHTVSQRETQYKSCKSKTNGRPQSNKWDNKERNIWQMLKYDMLCRTTTKSLIWESIRVQRYTVHGWNLALNHNINFSDLQKVQTHRYTIWVWRKHKTGRWQSDSAAKDRFCRQTDSFGKSNDA